jgi:hypothetical protein
MTPAALTTLCAWCPPGRKAAAPEGTPVSHTICPLCKPGYNRQRAELARLVNRKSPIVNRGAR